MCWRISFNKNPDDYRKIADKDITVYKIGYMTAECNFSGPLYKNFTYKPNVLNMGVKLSVEDKQILSFDKIHYEYQINEGYHSYSEKCCLKKTFRHSTKIITEDMGIIYHYGATFSAGKFIIPKGTEYYKNEDGEFVSSQLVWTGEIYLLADYINKISFKDLEYVLANR